MCPLEACVLQVNDALLYHPKEIQNHFQGLLHELFPSGGMTQSLPIFKKRLNTSLFDPLTLALSIIILFYLCFYFKNTHLTLYQMHIYSLTASFSCKTNSRFIFFYILVFLKTTTTKTPSYVCCVRLTGLVTALALLLVLIASVKSRWIKASAKCLS